jgi:hypothetical protein
MRVRNSTKLVVGRGFAIILLVGLAAAFYSNRPLSSPSSTPPVCPREHCEAELVAAIRNAIVPAVRAFSALIGGMPP